MMNIVIPMAGHGSRFFKAGYQEPKPLVSVLGKPMIEWVIENIRPSRPHRFIFICQAEHLRSFPLQSTLERLAPGCLIREVQGVTDGAACTALFAKDLIDTRDPLMIANCDQYVDVEMDAYLAHETADGLIMTMKARDNKWSFIELDSTGRVIRVAEKEVVSDEATVGIYNYRYGADFVCAAEQMISKNLRVNNEFYVAPVYNELIAAGKRITYYNIGSLASGMYGLGTPEDLEAFVAIQSTLRAIER